MALFNSFWVTSFFIPDNWGYVTLHCPVMVVFGTTVYSLDCDADCPTLEELLEKFALETAAETDAGFGVHEQIEKTKKQVSARKQVIFFMDDLLLLAILLGGILLFMLLLNHSANLIVCVKPFLRIIRSAIK